VSLSHVAALKQLIDVLTASTICKDEGHDPNPYESLTVEPSKPPVIASQEEDYPPLRVDKKLPCKVHFAPVPSTTAKPTYKRITGIWGTPCCRQHLLQPPKPISQAKTVHPQKSTHRAPVPTISHHYKMRSKGKLNMPIVFRQTALLGTAVNPDTRKIAEYKESNQCSKGPLWQASNVKEIGRLTQGFSSVKGTNTMFFIPHTDIPKNKKPTYLQVVAAFRPEKSDPKQIRWTVGGDCIFYAADVSTKTADLTTPKILFNSVLSTP
jgi:hypothetical protein